MYRKRECMLLGDKVLLVPYCGHHVDKYHSWMLDPVLRQQTASEPLTLEQEYEMQQSWMEDDNKCTFILLSKEAYGDPAKTETDSMVGDVNLFFSETGDNGPVFSTAEIDIMIAEPSYRSKGFGSEAVRLMMAYGARELGVQRYHAKIGFDNSRSIALFRDKLHFTEVSCSDVFREVTMEMVVSNALQTEHGSLCKWQNDHGTMFEWDCTEN